MRKLVDTNVGLWMLTGTPAAQSPLDAYGLAKLCVPQRAPTFYGDFRESVMYHYSMYRWEPRPEAKQIVYDLLQPAIRFTKDQCLDLPDMTFMTRIAPLSSEQQKYYKELKDEMLLEASGEEVSAVNAAAKMNKLLQISGGAVYTDSGAVITFDVSDRLRVIEEVIGEATTKVLIFVPFTHTIKLVSDHLTKAGINNEIIDGSVPVSKRTQIFKSFQEKDTIKVLVIQPQAAAHGVTLTAADTIIWYSPVTSVETYLQANARIDRPGQKHPMTVFHIQGSPMENRLYTMLQGNIQNHEKLVDLYKKELADT
jgi:superfamily II DNA or RNA helicase